MNTIMVPASFQRRLSSGQYPTQPGKKIYCIWELSAFFAGCMLCLLSSLWSFATKLLWEYGKDHSYLQSRACEDVANPTNVGANATRQHGHCCCHPVFWINSFKIYKYDEAHEPFYHNNKDILEASEILSDPSYFSGKNATQLNHALTHEIDFECSFNK